MLCSATITIGRTLDSGYVDLTVTVEGDVRALPDSYEVTNLCVTAAAPRWLEEASDFKESERQRAEAELIEHYQREHPFIPDLLRPELCRECKRDMAGHALALCSLCGVELHIATSPRDARGAPMCPPRSGCAFRAKNDAGDWS